MAKKIISKDVIDEGIFGNITNDAERLLLVVKDITKETKQFAKTLQTELKDNKISNADDVRNLESTKKATDEVAKSLDKLNKAEKKLERQRLADIKLQKDREKAVDKFNKQQQKAFELQKKQNSVYNQSVKRLSELKKELKELEITGRTNGKLYKALGAEFVVLNGKVRDAEEGVGEFFRNVGNYPQQLKELQKELRGLQPGTDRFIELSQRAGELKDKIDASKEATKAFASGSKAQVAKNLFGQIVNDLKDLDFEGAAEKARAFSKVVSSITFKEVISGIKNFGIAIGNLGKSLIKNPFTLILASIAAVGLALKSFYDSANAGKQSLEDLGQTLEGVSEKTRDLENEIKRLNIERDLLNEEITESTAKRRQEELKYNQEYVALLKEQEDVTKEFNDAITEERDQFGVKVGQIVGNTLDNETDLTKRQKIGLTKIEEAFLIRKNKLREKYELELDIINDEEIIKQKKLAKEKLRIERELQVKILEIQEERQISLLEDLIEGDIKIQEEYENKYQESLERILSSQSFFNGEEKKRLEFRKGLIISNLDSEFDFREQSLLTQANLEKRNIENSTEDERLKAAKIAQINEKLSRDLDNLIIERLNRENEIEKKYAKDREAIRQKEKKQIISFLNDTTNQTFNEINKRKQAQIKANQEEITERKDNIKRQEDLAVRGLDNTLEFEKQKQAEAELERRRLQEEQEKREKRQIFFKSVIAGLENAKSTDEALQSVARATAITAIAETVAGFFNKTPNYKDGVENFKGKGTETSDSNLVAISKGESVITAKGTKDYKGLSTAMNNGEVDKWIMSNYNQPQTQQTYNPQVLLALRSVEKAIKEKESININWQSHDTRVETLVRMGSKKTIKHISGRARI